MPLPQNQLTWLITGCSSGFGDLLAREALKRGDRVVATARNGTSRLASLQDAGASVYELDVTSSAETIRKTVADIVADVGDLDVLVNNAGYIEATLVEEAGDELFRASMETNFFGVLKVTQAVLPHFRAKRSGTVAMISSSGGLGGEPGAGPYCASKYAMEGMYECLRQETGHLGIKNIIFEPGYFRTKIMHPDNVKQRSSPLGEDYKEIREGVMGLVQAFNGHQPGDPVKLASIIVDVIKSEGVAAGKEMPERLPIGPDVLGQVRRKYHKSLAAFDEWEDIVVGTHSMAG